MIAGIIIGIILLVLALILLLPLSLRLRYQDTLTLSFEVLCFSFPIYRQGEQNKKRIKKAKKKKAKATTQKADTSPKKKSKNKARSVIHYIKLARRILSRIYNRFPNCFTIVIHRFEVIVGGKDAADAALRYGVVSQATAYVLTMAETLFRMKTKRNSLLSIQPNFLNGDSAISLDFKLTTRILSLLILLFRAWGVYRQVAKEITPPTTQPTKEGV